MLVGSTAKQPAFKNTCLLFAWPSIANEILSVSRMEVSCLTCDHSILQQPGEHTTGDTLHHACWQNSSCIIHMLLIPISPVVYQVMATVLCLFILETKTQLMAVFVFGFYFCCSFLSCCDVCPNETSPAGGHDPELVL